MPLSLPEFTPFLESLPDAALVVEDGGQVVLANARAGTLLGMAAGELARQPVGALLASADASTAEALRGLLAQPAPRPVELTLRRADGEAVPAAVSAAPLPAGDRRLVLLLIRDVTERRRAGQLLQQSEERLRQAVRVTRMGIFDHDQLTDTIYWSPEQRANYGWDADEPVTLEKFLAQVHPADRERIGRAVAQAHDPAGSGLFDVEHRIIRRDGAVRWLVTRSRTTFAGEGAARRPARTVGAVLDVTDQHEAADALRVFREAADLASEAIFWLDQEGRFVYVNGAACRSLGYSREELLRLSLWEVDPAYPRERWLERWAAFERHPGPSQASFESAHRRRDGGEFPVEVLTHHLPLDEGSIHVAYVRDISERRRAEERLRASEARLSEAQRIARMGSWELDLVHNVLTWSDEIFRIFEIDQARFGASYEAFLERVHPDDREPVNAAYRQSVESHTPYEITHRVVLPDGRIKYVRERAETHYDAAGTPVRSVGTVHDVTALEQAAEELRAKEAQLLQAQKMESVGRLAGGVAHDFNNLLTAISGHVELALLDLRPADPLHELLTEVQRAADSAANLTRQLLAFSRKQVIDPRVLDLNETVGGLQRMLQRLLGEDIGLRVVLDPGLGRTRMDPGQMEQILVNLAINARDAMPAGGTLTVETGNVTLDAEYAGSHPGATPGEYVKLAVSDEGTGLSEEVRAHLFEPFFTTKPQGKGTGLGLAMVYGAVKQNAGFIEVYSEPGHGTTFRIYLPRVEAAGEPVLAAVPAAHLPSGRETILLVEDDEQVRGVAVRLLRRLGYTVHAFAGASDALPAVQAMTGPLDLLLTDVVLAGMNGRVLADRIVALRPGIGVLFASGYSEHVVMHHGVLESGLEFLPKPYSIDLLARRVREVLDRPR